MGPSAMELNIHPSTVVGKSKIGFMGRWVNAGLTSASGQGDELIDATTRGATKWLLLHFCPGNLPQESHKAWEF